MSPKKTTKKRNKPDSSSPPKSPSQINPPKINAKSRKMPKDSNDEILVMLANIAAQQNQLSQQQNELNQQQTANTESLKCQISEQNEMLKNEMTSIINAMKSEFKAEIESINNKIEATNASCVSKVNDISDKVSNIDERMGIVEKDFERLAHMNELKLTGIPFTENEDLLNVFNKVANLIGYDVSISTNIPALSRIVKRNRLTNELSPTHTIIMKFIAIHLKETFYNMYLRLLPRKRITSKELGFSTEGRIVIGENLTKQNREIFIAASTLKRDGKLAQVFTVNGIINVKIQKGGTTHEIRHKHVLDIILNGTTTSSTIENTASKTTITDGMEM